MSKKQIIKDFDRIIGNNKEVTDNTHMDLVDECADYVEKLVNELIKQSKIDVLESLLEDIQSIHPEYIENSIKEQISILKHGI